MYNDISSELKTFVTKLVEEKFGSSISSEVRTQIEKDLLDNLVESINSVLLESIPEDKKTEFINIAISGDLEMIKKFIEKNVPNIQEIISNELIKFKDVYLKD